MKENNLLQEVLDLIKKNNVTAYEIEQNTSRSAVGIQKIINGETKKPLQSTLVEIYNYLVSKYDTSKDVIINSNIANNIKGNVNQTNGDNNNELKMKISLLEQENIMLKKQIEQYLELLNKAINK